MTVFSRRSGRALLAVTVLFVGAGCSSVVTGQPLADPAAARSSSAPSSPTGTPAPRTSGTATTPVTPPPTSSAPPVSYRVAAAGALPTVATSAQPWWGQGLTTDGSSSLTFTTATDDSASVYVQPTVPVVLAHTGNLAATGEGPLWPGTGLSRTTTGQLIVLISTTDSYLCSATVIHSAKQNLVVTASHCMWDAPVGKPHAQGGAAAASVAALGAFFVPGATGVGTGDWQVGADGVPEVAAPYGIWKVQAVTTNSYWLDNTYRGIDPHTKQPTDYGLGDAAAADVTWLTMAPDSRGRQIEQVTGGEGAMFTDTSQKTGVDITPAVVQLGYPAEDPFDGDTERYCASATTSMVRPQKGGDTYMSRNKNCLMNQGSSGGAWITGFDRSSGAGYVYAVESTGNPDTHSVTGAFLSVQRDYPLYRKLNS